MKWSRLMMAAATCLAVGCGDDGGANPDDASPNNGGGKADGANNGERSPLEAALDGREDPVADWLRTSASDQGVVQGTYREVLSGVAQQLGCDLASQRTFVILLTRAEYFPRNMMTLCSDDPAEASRFFLTTQSDNGTLGDIDPRDLKMMAWDGEARTYRFYELKPLADGSDAMQLAIDPPECRTCHTGPVGMDNARVPLTPVMNELVNPWTLWNAEPDFRSHQFDDTIDPTIAQAPYYTEMTEAGILDSASNFERHIRAGLDRVTNARLRTRRDPADLETSLSLLRPMFCDETLNYVSENHFTGETHVSAAIDDAIRRLFLTIRPDNWPYDWLNDGVMRLTVPEVDEEPIAVMPTRGEATIQVEVSLVSRRVLSAEQALRVRALDWRRPALSAFRCGLFEQGAARLRQSPPDLSATPRNSDLIPVLYDAIMQVEVFDEATGQTALKPLAPEGGTLISIPDVADADAAYALEVGRWQDYERDIDGFAQELEDHFEALHAPGGRAQLDDMRLERACEARLRFPAAPFIPGTEACQ